MSFKQITILALIHVVLIALIAMLWSQLSDLSSRVSSISMILESVKEKAAPQRYPPVHICTSSARHSERCETDFTRLASYPAAAQGKHLRIAGFLAIDNGVVTLFASQEDYKNMERGRSIEVKGTRSELTRLINEFGYSNVRLEGTFDVDYRQTRRGGWLGVLRPPVSGRKIYPRQSRAGVDDIAVDIRYIEAGE